MIEHYLTERDNLRCVIQLVDLRHPPSADDILMFDWLKHYEIPTIVVATKADKISRGKRPQYAKQIKQQLQTSPRDTIVTFSATTGEGKDELWQQLAAYV